MPGLHLPTGGSVSRMRTTAVRLRLRATAESNLQGKQTQLNGISKYEKKPRAEPRLSLGRRERGSHPLRILLVENQRVLIQYGRLLVT